MAILNPIISASWFETRRQCDAPHHEDLKSCRKNDPHPEGPPKVAVSKDGHEKIAYHGFKRGAFGSPRNSIQQTVTGITNRIAGWCNKS